MNDKEFLPSPPALLGGRLVSAGQVAGVHVPRDQLGPEREREGLIAKTQPLMGDV